MGAGTAFAVLAVLAIPFEQTLLGTVPGMLAVCVTGHGMQRLPGLRGRAPGRHRDRRGKWVPFASPGPFLAALRPPASKVGCFARRPPPDFAQLSLWYAFQNVWSPGLC